MKQQQKRDRLERRQFLAGSVKIGATLALSYTFSQLAGCSSTGKRPRLNLVRDPNGLCDLPTGFAYKAISMHGETMSDGHVVPDFHDGMGCFAAAAGGMTLVRNHEIPRYFPFDPPSPVPALAYDPEASGGTTTIQLNSQLEVIQQYLSLTGTIRNCGGGVTPWQTWISCEEASSEAWEMGRRHGYNFEVDPNMPLKKTEPLRAMGRFNHEAIGVDTLSGFVYQTEDNSSGCFYRFIPSVKGVLSQGGVLQALKLVNPHIQHTSSEEIQLNREYLCEWVTIDEPDPEQDNVRVQAQQKGAAIFVRGEGVAVQADGIYFACTTGGTYGIGQFFKYVPDLSGSGGTLELVYEAKQAGLIERPDNITLNGWGDLIICEDNKFDQQCLVGLTADGKSYYIAANGQSEWSGACFSPDGKILFANIQKKPGVTLAIYGPWQALRKNAI